MSVYYIHAPEVGLVKIGYAAAVQKRLRALRSTSPARLVLIAVEDGGIPQEIHRHRQFNHLREHGEWFRIEPDLIDHIDSLRPAGADETALLTALPTYRAPRKQRRAA